MTKPPFAPLALASARVTLTPRADGGFLATSPVPLAPHDASVGRLFKAAVTAAPDRIFLAERGPDGQWATLTYAEADIRVDALAQGLLGRGLGPEQPLLILAGNSIDHALLVLAGFIAGIPVATASPAYALQAQDFAKLRHVVGLITPGLVYVPDTAPFARALDALGPTPVLGSADGAGRGAPTLDALAAVPDRPVLTAALAATGAETVARILFTSGSTGMPKGVVNTHGMLTANQQMLAQIWPFLGETPPVLLDWLPWNHTFGANHNFNLVLRHAGTLYIDGGKPAPGLIEQTVRNLAELSPTVYFNVPAGFAGLLPHLERDEALARNFFRNLRLIFYAGAALPQDLWERLEALSIRLLGHRVPMTSSWGSTETAPLATAAHYPIERAGVIGLPVPGVTLKLVPSGGKLEVRVRGPNVTPGYWRRDDLTAQAFDDEGYYMIGDALRFVDPAAPEQGFVFDGRVAEDFKLGTGTWVHVGALRVGALAACSPVLQDALVTGHDRAEIGLLAWLNVAGCRALIGAELAPAELVAHPAIRAHVASGIARWNAEHPGSSFRIGGVLLLADPPSTEAGEITDKGYINQRIGLELRQAEVARLYADDPAVIRPT